MEAHLFESFPRDEGDVSDLRPGYAGDRVKVDPDLVGVVEILRADGMRVQVDAAQVHDPRQLSRIPDDDLLGRSARREAQFHGLDPFRP